MSSSHVEWGMSMTDRSGRFGPRRGTDPRFHAETNTPRARVLPPVAALVRLPGRLRLGRAAPPVRLRECAACSAPRALDRMRPGEALKRQRRRCHELDGHGLPTLPRRIRPRVDRLRLLNRRSGGAGRGRPSRRDLPLLRGHRPEGGIANPGRSADHETRCRSSATSPRVDSG
jgi:hypothetical protein